MDAGMSLHDPTAAQRLNETPLFSQDLPGSRVFLEHVTRQIDRGNHEEENFEPVRSGVVELT